MPRDEVAQIAAAFLADPRRDPVREANAYRDTMPDDDSELLWLARGEITWLREALRRSEREAVERAIDRMGWPEIHAYQAVLRKGQDIREDAGGFMLRAIKALFGIKPRDEVTTYRDAAAALLRQHLQTPSQGEKR